MPAVKQVAVKITITKAIEGELRDLADNANWPACAGKAEAAEKVARQLIARIDDARARKEITKGMNPYEVISIVKRICPMTVVPPDPGGVLSRVKQKVALLGLTPELVEKAAYRAKNELRHPMAITYFITRLDDLIGEREELVTADGETEVRVYDGRG